MTKSDYTAYKNAKPYFDLVREALGKLVDGEHFFDVVDRNTIYEVRYELGWPQIIKGRSKLMDAFKGYCAGVRLQSADKLITHRTDRGRVVVIEYEVHGTILATGAKYDNRFCSVIEIKARKIAHWRDYMDSLAASNAWSSRGR
jgi:uncharacterized protein